LCRCAGQESEWAPKSIALRPIFEVGLDPIAHLLSVSRRAPSRDGWRHSGE
jgi:hypothetical protein